MRRLRTNAGKSGIYNVVVKVLDSWTLMALFRDEPAAGQVERLLAKAEAGSARLMMSIINWGEIYCPVMRTESGHVAETVAAGIATLPIELVAVETDLALARQAAVYKATKKMSYADCFAAALAKLQNAALVTGDVEFRQVETEISIDWLPRA